MEKKRMAWFRGEGGFILITLYLLLVVFLAHATALVTRSFAEIRGAERFQQAGQAFYLAEAGLDRGFRWLQTQVPPPGGTVLIDPLGGWQNQGAGQYRFTVDPDDANPASFIDRYVIEGWGTVGNAARHTRLIVQTESFSRYAWYTNSELSPTGGQIVFRTGDVITGPMHTNGQFRLNGTPQFSGGPASSVSATVNLSNGATIAGSFLAGIELGVTAPAVPFPSVVPPALVAASQPVNGGKQFNGNTQITLLSNGTMQVNGGAPEALPANGVVYVNNGDLTLQGTLKGQLTIATNKDVRVAGPVRYATDPTVPNSNSTDLLGIVAGKNIIVNQVAYQNMRIDASLMALNTSFSVQNYSSGSPRGILTVLGGIIQKNRGAVGLVGNNAPGYLKNYIYDGRLINTTPPLFPTTGAYTTLVWEEQ